MIVYSSKLMACSKLTRLLETQRKQMTEKGFEIADLSSRFEKLQQNNKELQNMVMSKTGQIENAAAKKKRMEEEMLQLRKKLERAQKSEKLGSTDAVLNEEIRLLKVRENLRDFFSRNSLHFEFWIMLYEGLLVKDIHLLNREKGRRNRFG